MVKCQIEIENQNLRKKVVESKLKEIYGGLKDLISKGVDLLEGRGLATALAVCCSFAYWYTVSRFREVAT